MEKIKGWIRNGLKAVKQNPKEFWILLVILLIGSFLRLYKISEYMTFLGDEGRDAIIVRRLLVLGDPILVGPGTSIGNMYLGPLYYYFIAPGLLIANFSPAGPAVQIAVLGIFTIVLVWWMGREWFGKIAGLIAASLYALSPTVIIYSRSSWNPNIMPFFALVSIYSIWRVWQKYEFKWLVILGVAFAFTLQSHYLALLLVPTLGLFWLLTYVNLKKVNDSSGLKSFLHKSLLSLALFSLLMSPLLLFDIRHNWLNFNAMKKFFGERQTTVSVKPWKSIPKIYPQFEKINTRLLTARNENAGKAATLLIVISLIYLFKKKRKSFSPSHLILFTWLTFALIGLGLYKQEIYDHYYGFFFAAPFLLVGAISQNFIQNIKRNGKIITLLIILYLVIINLIKHPFTEPSQKQMQRAQAVSVKIAEEARGERFNLAVIAERNYEDGYQYFLELNNLQVIDIDAQRPETTTDVLFVVCEVPKEKCDPTHSAKAEVANFGWSKIEDEWEVFGTRIFKLVHTQD